MSSSGEGGTSRVEHHGCAPRVGHAGAAEVVGRDGAASVATHGVPLAQPRRIEHEAASTVRMMVVVRMAVDYPKRKKLASNFWPPGVNKLLGWNCTPKSSGNVPGSIISK